MPHLRQSRAAPLLALLLGLLSSSAWAYSAAELLEDCRIAEESYAGQRSSDPFRSLRSNRCIAYVAGFVDGYTVSDYLAEKVGLRLNAICLPKDEELPMRLVRAVVIHVERTPPDNHASTANLVAGALAKAFPCNDRP